MEWRYPARRMAQRKKATPAVDAAALAAEVRDTLAREGAVKLSSVKPAELRTILAEMLSREGFEVTQSVIRRPLRAQLLGALAHGALVPVKSLSAHVRGAAAAELKRLTEDAIREGLARRVLRGTAEVLAGEDVRVLSGAEVESMRLRVVGLGKALEKVTKKPGLSLLASDAQDALEQAITAVTERGAAQTAAKATHASVTPQKPSDEPMRALLAAVDSTRDVRTGLSFVPAVVGRLAPTVDAGAAVKLLLSAAERELLELRPEGGIGRLSEAELSVCPAGPHGTRLSWARRLTGGAP
jgi:hypothetical protein